MGNHTVRRARLAQRSGASGCQGRALSLLGLWTGTRWKREGQRQACVPAQCHLQAVLGG